MFSSNTLFIVGAGASKEVGLPTGAELKPRIASKLGIEFEDGFRQSRGDHVITQALALHAGNSIRGIDSFVKAAWAVRDAMPQALSIDNFIDAHRDDEKIALVGKLGIVRCILEAERDSRVYIDLHGNRRMNFNSLEESWFSSFFKMLTEGIQKEKVDTLFDKINFITFNYDRTLEHFLEYALKNYYNLDAAKAQDVVRRLSVTHPYGQVGSLPWQAGSTSIEFGDDRDNAHMLLSVSNQVKTFTERIEDEVAIHDLRARVQSADTIVFLGFAFHPMNMELIGPEKPGVAKRIFGTAMGISPSDVRAVKEDLVTWLKCDPRNVQIELRNDLTCAQLFSEFWRSMPR